MRWAAWSVAGVVAIVHLLTADRYGYFVNELYFIVCGRHPAFGYVDQPPLVPLIAAATQFAGTHLWVLRLPAVLAATLLVPLTVAFAGLLGASTRGARLSPTASRARYCARRRDSGGSRVRLPDSPSRRDTECFFGSSRSRSASH